MAPLIKNLRYTSTAWIGDRLAVRFRTGNRLDIAIETFHEAVAPIGKLCMYRRCENTIGFFKNSIGRQQLMVDAYGSDRIRERHVKVVPIRYDLKNRSSNVRATGRADDQRHLSV